MIDPNCDITPLEIFEAYFDCRKTKRTTKHALNFEENLESNLMDLYHELRTNTYKPGVSICFVVEYPKVREVWAADFRDRVVHHLLYNRVSKRFHRRYIHDSYACIPEKGTHKAVERAGHFARSITQNDTVEAFVLKMDVANFFVSIDKNILEKQLARLITEPWWMELTKIILHHDPTTNVILNSRLGLMAKVPKHKSLFHSNGRGLAIGNLSSQFFANVYMDDLDQYAKRELKIKRYIRYVDDIIIFGESGSELNKIVPLVDEFIKENLNLKLHPNKTSINHVHLGFDVLGFIIRPFAKYVRRSTIRNGYKVIKKILSGDEVNKEKLRATVNSYFGLFCKANAWGQRKKLASILKSNKYSVNVQLDKMLLRRKKF